MVYQYIPQRSISYLMFILYGTVDARQLYCLQKDIQPRSGQPTGQKVEIACFHISATFWLLKIIVLCVYVCTKHINIQLYWNSIRENHTTPPTNTAIKYTQWRIVQRAESSTEKIFFPEMKVTDKNPFGFGYIFSSQLQKC